MGLFDSIPESFRTAMKLGLAVIAIKNATPFTLEMTYLKEHDGEFVETTKDFHRPGNIAAGQTWFFAYQKRQGPYPAVDPNKKFEVFYRKEGGDADMFCLDMFIPFEGENKYYHTGIIGEKNKLQFLAQEGGDFRHNLKGSGSLTPSAEFTIIEHPYVGQHLELRVPKTGILRSPSAVTLGDKIFCFHAGQSNNLLWYNVYHKQDGKWQWRMDWRVDGSGLLESPGAVVFQDKIYVFHQSLRIGELWYAIVYPDGRKDNPVPVPGSNMSCTPSAVVYNDKIYIAFQGAGRDGSIWWNTFDGKNWGNFQKIDGARCSDSPALVTWGTNPSRLWCYHQEAGLTGRLLSIEFFENRWQSPRMIENTMLSSSPSPIAVKNTLYVFHRASNNGYRLYVNAYNFVTQKWTGDIEFTDSEMSGSPSATALDGRIFIFHEGKNGDQQLWYKSVRQPAS